MMKQCFYIMVCVIPFFPFFGGVYMITALLMISLPQLSYQIIFVKVIYMVRTVNLIKIKTRKGSNFMQILSSLVLNILANLS